MQAMNELLGNTPEVMPVATCSSSTGVCLQAAQAATNEDDDDVASGNTGRKRKKAALNDAQKAYMEAS